jgi:hypothetical protein
VFITGVPAEAHKRIKYERARTLRDALAIAIQCESYANLAKAVGRPVRATAAQDQTAADTATVRRTTADDRRSRPCPNCSKSGHLLSECTKPHICCRCRKPGHISRSCTTKASRNSQSGEKKGNQ